MTTFGPDWTAALVAGADSLSVPPEWPLAVIAIESGFNPLARNASTAAFGLWQKMPPYAVTDPVRQLQDAFAFWRVMVADMRVDLLRTREAFYCLNLAPARLRFGQYNDDTALYAAPSIAYRENAGPFGLDPYAKDGSLRIRDLAHGLDAAIARCLARYDAELAAASSSCARGWVPDDQPAAVVERERPTR